MSDRSKLDPQRIGEIFEACLFKEGEDTTDHVTAEGVMFIVSFHPQRLQAYATEIAEMLAELPTEFQQSGGGGWSFLNACMDKDGNQWTGEHRTMDQLFILGIGIGKTKYLAPRDLWDAFPGGMPYLIVTAGAP